jgi:hypothetical protein
MGSGELERVEVRGRVAKEELKLIDAAAMLTVKLPPAQTLVATASEGQQRAAARALWGRVSINNRSQPAKISAPGAELAGLEVGRRTCGAVNGSERNTAHKSMTAGENDWIQISGGSASQAQARWQKRLKQKPQGAWHFA